MHAVSHASNAYRGTIRAAADGERKYIRYFDGRGHFGHLRLRLIPRSGAQCAIVFDAECSLPGECCEAARAALVRRLDMEPRSHLALIGFEVHVTGGSYLAPHSYPEAYAHAACMAFDEAFHRAGPLIVEPYIGIALVVEMDDLVWTIKALGALLGEMHTTQRVTNVVHLKVDVPVRLIGTIRSTGIRITKQFPIPSDERYRPLLTPKTGDALPDNLRDWT